MFIISSFPEAYAISGSATTSSPSYPFSRSSSLNLTAVGIFFLSGDLSDDLIFPDFFFFFPWDLGFLDFSTSGSPGNNLSTESSIFEIFKFASALGVSSSFESYFFGVIVADKIPKNDYFRLTPRIFARVLFAFGDSLSIVFSFSRFDSSFGT